MNAPDKIWAGIYGNAVEKRDIGDVEYIRADLHQSALADRDAELASANATIVLLKEERARLQAILTDAQDAVAIRQHALELRTAENERLQARLDAGPSVEQLQHWGHDIWDGDARGASAQMLETANRMEEAANGK